ncbi:MAG TPA: hypothetical protein EYP14_04720 [Planctomycetaceae bacterium]|nr:hypothetical protein [Planctomycetaceae bacterium]
MADGVSWPENSDGSASSPIVLGMHLLFASLIASGCQGDVAPRRVAVSGTVRQTGSPVEQGSISFLPEKGLQGPAANTAIRQGRYHFTASNGPSPGPHRVLIVLAPEQPPEGGSATGPFKAKGPPPGTRRDSPGDQTRWEFHIVVPDEPKYEKNFVLD